MHHNPLRPHETRFKQTFAPIVLRCVALGLPRILLDGGPETVEILTMMLADVRSGEAWAKQWADLTAPKLIGVLSERLDRRGTQAPTP